MRLLPGCVLLLFISVLLGCSTMEEERIQAERPPRPKRRVANVVSTDHPWGPAHNGLQLRISPSTNRDLGYGEVHIHVRSTDEKARSLELGGALARAMNFAWHVNGKLHHLNLSTGLSLEPVVVKDISRKPLLVDRAALVWLSRSPTDAPRSRLGYKPGTYTIFCELDGLRSNAVTLLVTDDIADKYED